MKIAILYIGIGDYANFFDEFHATCEKFFLNSYEKNYFVFSNIEKTIFNKYKKTQVIYQKDLGWPENTLKRFEMFKKIERELSKYDYIYFFNGNTLFIDFISKEDFIPKRTHNYLIGLSWHIYDDKKNFELGYERRKKSLAYIPYGKGKRYYQGGIIGGRTKEFFNLISECYNSIEIDLDNNIIAKSNDESHINHYFFKKEPKCLNTVYGCPEEWLGDFKNSKIIFRDKNKVLGKTKIKELKKCYGILFLVKKILNKCKRNLLKNYFNFKYRNYN